MLRTCAARMIVAGSWNDLTDKAIKKAFAEMNRPKDEAETAIEYRDSGELREEIHRQLAAL